MAHTGTSQSCLPIIYQPPSLSPLCIMCPCLLSMQEVIFRHLLLFPSLGATLRGVSSCSAAVRSTHLQGNLNFQTCTIIILPCQGNAYLVTCLLFLLFVLNDIFLVCSGGYKIAPRACEVSGVQGTCMFVWECLKTEGQVRCCFKQFGLRATRLFLSASGHVYGRLHVWQLLCP